MIDIIVFERPRVVFIITVYLYASGCIQLVISESMMQSFLSNEGVSCDNKICDIFP